MPGNTRGWDELRARIAELESLQVRVGIVGDEANAQHGDNPGVTNGDVALWMEYGTKALPERSFIRKTFRSGAKLGEFRALQLTVVKGVIAGTLAPRQAIGQLGAWGAGAIQRTIVNDEVTPALKQSTVDRKGSSKVLIDSGQLVRSISFVVVP